MVADEAATLCLRVRFDAVLMLTSSNWRTEPRSNRYHYATRFARELPVLFVQRTGHDSLHIQIEPSGADNIDIVHVSEPIGEEQVGEVLTLLRARAIRRPLLWVYNTQDYERLLDALPGKFSVYHATEDYLFYSMETDPAAVSVHHRVAASIQRTISRFDLLVGVSDGVVRTYTKDGGFRGRTLVAPNGCDAQFFFDIVDRFDATTAKSEEKIVIYQGGINRRLDFELLHGLVHLLADWKFWFCGQADDSLAAWLNLKAHANVRYFGALEPTRVAELMCSATIGLVPYIQTDWIRNSLPLKAFEYVACGLPVVTVEIDALGKYPELFVQARDAKGFANAIEAISPTRFEATWLARRRRAAAGNSYDERIREVFATIAKEIRFLHDNKSKLNVAILYDERWNHIGTVNEHLQAFRKYSRHEICFMPGTMTSRAVPAQPWSVMASAVDLSVFDVIIVHYAIRLSIPEYLNEGLAQQIERFHGLKILFIQDEYEATETARQWMDRLQFDVVYTCVPPQGREYVYPSYRFPATDFLPTLTGYVPERLGIELFAKPLAERDIRIGYRGRVLSPVYGSLAQEKYRIGVDMKRLAQQRGVNVDIEVDDSKRIYGDDWYRFLGSVRATLGTESGSNVFDFDGSLRTAVDALMKQCPGIEYEEVHRRLLAPHEGHVSMNQVSPKIFEAIRLRTALILFDGEYSGVVQRDVHYIPLAKDYTNAEEVFRKLDDVQFLEELTANAYRDVIESGLYSYRRFVEGVDSDIEARVLKGPRYVLYSTPTVARAADGTCKVLLPREAVGFAVSNQILGDAFQREQIAEAVAAAGFWVGAGAEADRANVAASTWGVRHRSIAFRIARVLPAGMRSSLMMRLRSALREAEDPTAPRGLTYRALRPIWRCTPAVVRAKVIALLRR